MHELWLAIGIVIFGGDLPPDGPKWIEPAAFALVCAALNAVVVIVDLLYFWFQKLNSVEKLNSVLGIKHGLRTLALLVIGVVAAGLVGVLSNLFNVFQFNILAAGTVALSWHVVFARIASGLRARAEDVQIPTEEE